MGNYGVYEYFCSNWFEMNDEKLDMHENQKRFECVTISKIGEVPTLNTLYNSLFIKFCK